MSKRFFCKSVLLPAGWSSNVLLEVNQQGRISGVTENAECPEDAEQFDGWMIPGMPNVHSHAFQRAMVGMTEYRTAEQDSFWTWRNEMYRWVEQMTPDRCYSIASQLYVEMLQAGYASVGEFHYLHHPRLTDSKGLQMADAILRAAVDVGIRICFLPVLYQRGGFRDEPLGSGQQQFYLDDTSYFLLLENVFSEWHDHPLVSIGIALHSLRAVAPAKIASVVEQAKSILGEIPIHIHIAEQLAEVETCLEVHGSRPVELLFQHANVDKSWCLIHATHLIEREIQSIAESGAVVGLCPLTEANLGDGIFPSRDFKSSGGRWAIGSDSHISVDPFSELRMIEYGQRLTHRNRAVLSTDTKSTGTWLFQNAVDAGASILQCNPADSSGGICENSFADWVVLSADHANRISAERDRALDKLVFFESDRSVEEVWIGGEKVVANRKHLNADSILSRFHEAMDSFSR